MVYDRGDKFVNDLVDKNGYYTYSFGLMGGILQLNRINSDLADGTIVSISTGSVENGGGVGFGEIGTDGKEIPSILTE